MAKTKILVKGYAKEIDGEEHASSTATLIQENGLNIIVDPGIKFFRNPMCPVSRIVVNKYYFTGKFEPFKTFRQVFFFVFGNDNY